MSGETRGRFAVALACGLLAAGNIQCGRSSRSTPGGSAGAGAGAGGAGVGGGSDQVVAAGGSQPDDRGSAGGAGHSSTDSGGEAGATLDVPVEPAKNYELNGMMADLKAAIATTPGKLTYTKLVIQNQFLAESCSIADYNNDGIPDVSSGRQWYEGTNSPTTTFKTAHAFRDGHGPLPRDGNGPELNTGVSDDSADYPLDVDGDGWSDIINVASPDTNEVADTNPKIGTVQPHATAYWYKNPGLGLAGDPKWKATLMNPDVRMEQHGLADMNGDGFPELLGACKSCTPPTTKGYYQANPTDANAPWTFHSVTIAYPFPYGGLGKLKGIGAGDVNGDGRIDLLERGGIWLQQPGGTWNATQCTGKDEPAGCGWIAEKTPLLPTGIYDGLPDNTGGKGPSQIYAADMDGDGLTDLVAADFAFGEGLYWYRQTEDMKFVKYQFMGGASAADVALWGAGFSSPMAVQVVDMDGDGAPDVVTGKMRFPLPHGSGVPDADGVPYVYVFKNLRGTPNPNGGPITLEPHQVDGGEGPVGTLEGGMGVGRQIAIGHLNTDGIPDICVASKVGLAVFLGQ